MRCPEETMGVSLDPIYPLSDNHSVSCFAPVHQLFRAGSFSDGCPCRTIICGRSPNASDGGPHTSLPRTRRLLGIASRSMHPRSSPTSWSGTPIRRPSAASRAVHDRQRPQPRSESSFFSSVPNSENPSTSPQPRALCSTSPITSLSWPTTPRPSAGTHRPRLSTSSHGRRSVWGIHSRTRVHHMICMGASDGLRGSDTSRDIA